TFPRCLGQLVPIDVQRNGRDVVIIPGPILAGHVPLRRVHVHGRLDLVVCPVGRGAVAILARPDSPSKLHIVVNQPPVAVPESHHFASGLCRATIPASILSSASSSGSVIIVPLRLRSSAVTQKSRSTTQSRVSFFTVCSPFQVVDGASRSPPRPLSDGRAERRGLGAGGRPDDLDRPEVVGHILEPDAVA